MCLTNQVFDALDSDGNGLLYVHALRFASSAPRHPIAYTHSNEPRVPVFCAQDASGDSSQDALGAGQE